MSPTHRRLRANLRTKGIVCWTVARRGRLGDLGASGLPSCPCLHKREERAGRFRAAVVLLIGAVGCARRTLCVAMPINWEDLEILGALDRLEDAGRAYSNNGEDLLQAVADGRSVGDNDRNGFARILLMLRDETPHNA
jgi:hypothetical protein